MDVNEFAKKYLDMELPPHQQDWVHFLDSAGQRCILLAPRGHGKTTIVNLIYLSWLIARDPTLHILIVSHSKEMAESFSRSVRNIFEREDIQDDFNIEIGSPWRANSWTLKSSPQSKPTVRTIGVMGRMTGWRGDIIIFDDLLEINAISSEATRVKIDNWIKTEVLPALNPGAKERVIVVGTRKHIADWYGQLLGNPDYQNRVDKAFLPDGSPLWPERFTKEVLQARKRELGALKFAQEYMNEPAPPEGLMFKYDWLKFFEHLPDRPLKYYMGVDPSAGKKNTRSEYAVAVVAHDFNMDTIYVTDLYKGVLTKREQVQKTFEYAAKYKGMEGIYIENVFEYTHVYEALVGQFPNVYGKDYIHTPISGTTAVKKEERIQNILAPAIEQGRLIFKNPTLDLYTRQFIEEEYVPFPTGYMDMLDALTLAVHSLVGTSRITEVPWVFY